MNNWIATPGFALLAMTNAGFSAACQCGVPQLPAPCG
jgi:hypothetical protein